MQTHTEAELKRIEEEKKAQQSAKEHAETMRLILQQEDKIRKEVADESPLIGDCQSIDFLQIEYTGNEPFLIKIQHMAKKYSHYRKTRGDGSCFYRALLYRIFEVIILQNDAKLKEHMIKKIKDSSDFLKKAGIEGLVFADVQQLFVGKLEELKPQLKTEQLVKMFRDPDVSTYLVLMLRFLTSAQLKNNAILYETFIDNGLPIEFFCQTEVQPIDKEADQIQIMALLAYLQLSIKIVYLDGNITSSLQPTAMVIPEDSKGPVHIVLLYRPGHYDILYE